MMNQIPQMGMGAAPELTEEELRKLALLLQQMPEGEGLAAVSSVEEQQMKADGGAGTPLPGTQGLGPAGGQVKSYAKKEDGIIDEDHRIVVATNAEIGAMQFIKEQEKGQGFSSGNGPLITALSALSTTEPDYFNYKGMSIPTLNDSADSEGGETSDTVSSTETRTTYDYSGGGSTPTVTDTTGSTSTYKPPVVTPDPIQTYPYLDLLTPEEKVTVSGLPPSQRAKFDQPIPEEKKQEVADTTWQEVVAAAHTKAGPKKEEETIEEYHARYMATLNQEKDDNGLSDTGALPGLPDPAETATFKDQDGNEWPTQEAALAADAAINEIKAAQVPKMVETMNNFFTAKDEDGNPLHGPDTTYDEFLASIPEGQRSRLDESVLRNMYGKAVKRARRGLAFTLTPEEVAEFERDAISVTAPSDMTGPTIAEVTAATAPTVGATTVGEIGDITAPELDAIKEVTDEDMDVIFAGGVGDEATGINDAEALLLARVEGTAVSPAEVQLKRTTENHLRMLLGATAGGDADPAKMRQLKNIWADTQQHIVGEAAELRSQESMAAEKELVALYTNKSTMKLNASLANMEMRKQEAFKKGDLEMAASLSNQQAVLTKVITQANINSTAELTKADMKLRTELANLQTMKDLAIEQGKMDLATSLGNLQKEITIATVNGDLALKSRLSDDSLAIANYKGQMALEGMEVQVDTVQMQADLEMMGFELTRDLAEMDAQTRRYVAELTRDWNMAMGDAQKQGAIIGMIGTAITAYGVYAAATSDIRAKTNISAADDEVESFLDALNAYQYEYKDPNAPGADEGMFAGVMAQDLEDSPMGASFVKDTPDGKQVDYGHGLAAILASQANIHQRLKELEGA